MNKLRWAIFACCFFEASIYADAPIVVGHIATAPVESSTQTATAPIPMEPMVSPQAFVSVDTDNNNSTSSSSNISSSDSSTQAIPQGSSPASLAAQIQIMQDQMRQMQGQLEMQAHQLEMMQQGQVKTPVSPLQTPQPTNTNLATPLNNATTSTGSTQKSAIPTATSSTATVTTAANPSPNIPPAVTDISPQVQESELATNPVLEQQTYDQAYQLLLSKKYDDAEKGMQKYLQQYPKGMYAGNAHYWLGELYLATGNSTRAMTEFQTVSNNFQSSPKAADAMLKIAFIDYNAHNYTQSALELHHLIAQYPNSPAVPLAQKHLNEMKAEGKIKD
jgi:tol-pal system protein YbgF